MQNICSPDGAPDSSPDCTLCTPRSIGNAFSLAFGRLGDLGQGPEREHMHVMHVFHAPFAFSKPLVRRLHSRPRHATAPRSPTKASQQTEPDIADNSELWLVRDQRQAPERAVSPRLPAKAGLGSECRDMNRKPFRARSFAHFSLENFRNGYRDYHQHTSTT